MAERSKAKDVVAATLIYGGSTAVQAGFFAAAIAAGLISSAAAHGVQHAARAGFGTAKKEAWQTYKDTGSILEALSKFSG